MKLHNTQNQQYQTVTAYDDHSVEINAITFKHSLLVLPELPPITWPVSNFAALTEEHFQTIAALRPDVVILGTGIKQRFAHPKLTACLINQRIGVESMDSQAACRTYNILMTEGRKVALALIIEAKEENPA
ncbi:Mth938-like domain-containing protein [Solimicrobium silvestre]|nr:Mth938-like domain-containing protein [Solimicrobium silvestre]